MANIVEITSLSAPELDLFARLTESQLRSRQEPEKGIFIAEGLKVIGHTLDAGCIPVAFLVERRHIEGKARDAIARCGDIPVYTADSAVLSALTGFALTRGVICAMRRPAPRALGDVCTGAKRLAVLDGLVDPANVGAIFRSAAALGMDAVLLTQSCCDPLNRRAVRVSMGTVFQIPWARIGGSSLRWPEEGLARLKEMGFSTAAMALSDNSVAIDDPELCAREKLAVILGSEGDGLAADTIACCDYTVRIPMQHGVDSLNVAAASALAFWQLRRC